MRGMDRRVRRVGRIALAGTLALLWTVRGPAALQAAPPRAAAPPPCAPVTWTDVVNASVTGSTLQKTGTLVAWDAGGASTASLVSGNGSAQLTADTTTYGRMFGLTHDETTPSYTDITYALELQSNGTLDVYESGSYRAQVGTYQIGDVLKVAVENGRINYYRNGSLLRTSTLAPSYPLQFDGAIRDPGGRLTNPMICGTLADTAGDWPTYVADTARSGFNSFETQITPATAPTLQLKWTVQASGGIFTQPVAADGLVFWGSDDGNEHATTPSGSTVWTTFLGRTTVPVCSAPVVPAAPARGIVSTGTVATVSLGGVATSVLFVGGGDAQFYALNARTGAIIWHTRLGPSPNNFIYGSPALYNGSIYVGLASFGDCPLTQGKFFKLDAITGAIQATFNVVPNGCIGGDVWGSPSVDQATSMIYIATGNPASCATAELEAPALLELRASDLSLVGSWRVPASSQVSDSDFGSAPTLFTATSGSTVRRLVGIANKNGVYYAFARDNLGAGPIWSRQIAVGSSDPPSGGSIAPSAWDGATLYAAGGPATINGVSCQGTVWALAPGTGAVLWNRCFNDGSAGGAVIGAVTSVPGLVVVGMGRYIVVLSAAAGHTLFAYLSDAAFWSGASIAHGVLYQGNNNGHLYALEP